MARKKAASQRKHVPTRTCAVCREARAKRDLTRLVRGQDEALRLDPGGKLPGRGAYLCDKPDCWHRAARGKALDRALKMELREVDREMLQAHAAMLDV